MLPTLNGVDRVWFHWGMACLAYQFFRDTSAVVGRLLTLQDDFTTAQVQSRLLSSWGDRPTIKQAAHASVPMLTAALSLPVVAFDTLGRAGMTEREVRTSGRKALIGKMPMKSVGRAKERGETQGFMKVLIDAENQRILGAAILGIGGDEVVHSILDIMYADVPYTVIQRAVHIHPTVTELIPTMLGSLEPLD